MLTTHTFFSYVQLAAMRKLKQGDTVSPMAPLGNNFRPPQPLHQRAIRTNIDLIHSDRLNRPNSRGFTDSDNVDISDTFSASSCPSMGAKKFYQVSPEHLAVSSNFLDRR
ncbi:carbonic anhydrase-related protein 10-like [Tropilaelaps mercedesae]|uniref:Carbonic anhydrase-related protein 10-like n=1 Tax=Tropilaelaps mercedesae TaxID=418985 RepID=A0A1V9XSJ9_9ACAR|nr:carbonic anhydrase-related protein 10-like [Tropilaelaps mercedesae]